MKVQQGHNRTVHPRASLLIIAFPAILHLNPCTDGTRRRRTDSIHDWFARAAIVSTKAEETKRLCRNRVLKMVLRNLVHYFRVRIHTHVHEVCLSIYARSFANVTHKPLVFRAKWIRDFPRWLNNFYSWMELNFCYPKVLFIRLLFVNHRLVLRHNC